MVTRRVAQRQFLLKPTPESKDSVRYCFHRAAKVYGIEIHALTVLDNHYHAILTDCHGELPKFMAWVDREIAHCVNEIYDRSENLWSVDHYSSVVLHDAEAVIGKLEYLFCNVVAALLVRDYRDWHGVRSTPADWDGRVQKAVRPKVRFSQRDKRWAEVEVRYTIPPALRDRDPDELIAEMQRRIEARQREIVAEAKRNGRSFVGTARLEKLSPFDYPKSPRKKGKLNPTFAAGTPEGQRRARAMLKHFRSAYREALSKWRNGQSCVFPAGCYWLARFANVCVAPLETAYPALESG